MTPFIPPHFGNQLAAALAIAIFVLVILPAAFKLGRAIKSLHQRRKHKTATETRLQQQGTALGSTSPQWFPLPGGTTLEYLDTGYTIRINGEGAPFQYALLPPDWQVLGHCDDLQTLKKHGASVAAARAEFNPPQSQRGQAHATTLAGAAAMAAALCWLGPRVLDALPADGPTYASHGYTAPALDAGEIALLDAQARQACANTTQHGPEGGYMRLPNGDGLQCTDKHGRHRITILNHFAQGF